MQVFGSTFIGKRVLAVMDFENKAAWVVGTLTEVSDDGEFVIETAEGRRYCWPLLHVELAPAPEDR